MWFLFFILKVNCVSFVYFMNFKFVYSFVLVSCWLFDLLFEGLLSVAFLVVKYFEVLGLVKNYCYLEFVDLCFLFE